MLNSCFSSLRGALIAFAVLSSVAAAPLKFDFKDPKGINNVQFHLDAPLESTGGQGTGLSGEVVFDPTAPSATTGKIVLATSSLTLGNPKQLEHMLSPMWLNAAAFPEIVFEAKSLDHVKTDGNTTTADVTGVLTLKGVSKSIVAPVTFTYLPGKLGARIPSLKGDLLVLRTKFSINRSDFGIQPGQMLDKVAEHIDLELALAGAAAQ